ncbi:hypothetical protein M427DRAFT_206805 [Gonapodya prolifera JEL478]|uniref:Uncharacterized protein n=1 Tax=Gonapodya prolifera (strain JEL478) TaxID=1344416 RepID=A0A138ZZ54_GONPJ|nr:hypothetical protein M427DRAFT_206805 [Gonapodya prolifera JEL478]|eukprot:KXS09792.1 hypothetical protein M427DRAFT_206805 [Gonapodya prolifera JEL478]
MCASLGLFSHAKWKPFHVSCATEYFECCLHQSSTELFPASVEAGGLTNAKHFREISEEWAFRYIWHFASGFPRIPWFAFRIYTTQTSRTSRAGTGGLSLPMHEFFLGDRWCRRSDAGGKADGTVSLPHWWLKEFLSLSSCVAVSSRDSGRKDRGDPKAKTCSTTKDKVTYLEGQSHVEGLLFPNLSVRRAPSVSRPPLCPSTGLVPLRCCFVFRLKASTTSKRINQVSERKNNDRNTSLLACREIQLVSKI